MEDSGLKMSVSPVCTDAKGEKYAFVSFSDQKREAEGRIPECRIIRNKGFNDWEIEQLENYMKKELTKLKKIAAGNNVLKAFMK